MKRHLMTGMALLAWTAAVAADGGVVAYEQGKVYGPMSILGEEAVTVDGHGAVIDGGGTNRCATLGPNVTLRNFTFRNGKAAFGGGVWGGRIENCAIRDCIATESGAAVANCKARATTISGCRRPLNGSVKAATHGGIAADSTLDGVTITGCRVELGPSVPGFGGIAANSALDDCAVTDNALVIAGDHYGYLFYGGSLGKSTVQGNSVDSSPTNVAAYMKVMPVDCALDGDDPLPPPGTKKLTVKSNGTKYGTVGGGGYYAEGEEVTLKAKAKSGYVFTGWFTDKDCTEKLVLDAEGYDYRQPQVKYAMPAKKTTVYAKFNSVSYDKKHLKFSSETQKLAKSAKTYTAGEAMAALMIKASSASLPSFSAKDLPKGMKIDTATGAITGMTRVPGKYIATVTVESAAGNAISQKVKIYVKVASGYYGTFDGYALVKNKTSAYVTFTSDKYGAVSGKVTYKGKGYPFTAGYSAVSSSRAKFTPSIKIGSSTYKPVTYVERQTDGITVSEARGEQEGKFVFVAQKKPGLIKTDEALAGLIGRGVTVTNKKYADAKLPKSKDSMKLKFAATDVVKATGTVGGKDVSFSTTVVYCRKKGDVYTAEVALIEPKSGYSRLATFTLTVGKGGAVSKKVSFSGIQADEIR